MSKVLDATCNAGGVVTAEGSVVTDAVVLSEGMKASEGVLIMEDDKATYVTSNATDIADLIQAVSDILTNVVTVLGSHDGTLGGSQAAVIAQITEANLELVAMKETLK